MDRTFPKGIKLLTNPRKGTPAGRLTRVRATIRTTTTILRLVEGTTRALARHALAPALTLNPQLIRTRAVQVHRTPGGATVDAAPSRGDHHHREVKAVDEAEVVEVLAAASVKCELRQCSGRRRPSSGAVYFSRSAISSLAGEFSGGGVGGAECSSPEAAAPRHREVDGLRGAGLKSESSDGKL
ncbi:hypothetical protein V2J09_019859 [Rumex salicifolius]